MAYYEPLRFSSAYMRAGARCSYEANLADRTGRTSRVESLLRQAIEHYVNAFLVDRAAGAEAFRRAHALGRQVRERFDCPLHLDDSGWRRSCGVNALHARVGLSVAGASRGRCSVCGADDFECHHVPGRAYGGVRCVREIFEHDVSEISLVTFPDDPRCYRIDVIIPRDEMVRQLRRAPVPGENPSCDHCLSCTSGTSGPSADDLDQTLWPSMEND